MRLKLETQVLLVLLCVIGIAGAWIGIEVARDSFGIITEPYELHLETADLLGLGPRSEVHCAGALIGHVREIVTTIGADGLPHFTIIAGVRREYSSWRFAPHGIAMAGVVQSALSPSWVNLVASNTPDAVQARRPKDGLPPTLRLERDQSSPDFSRIAERIDHAVDELTGPQTNGAPSAIQELTQAIHHLNGLAASLDGQSLSTETDPAKRPPVDQLLSNLDSTTGNLKTMTASLDKTVGQGGELDQTLATLTETLVRAEKMTEEMTKTITRLNLKIDTSLGKVNGLLDETSDTMTTLHSKADHLGETFLGRMLIGKSAKNSTPTPTPEKKQRSSH
jgi:ABC-type transporter Mla subunit MlaD